MYLLLLVLTGLVGGLAAANPEATGEAAFYLLIPTLFVGAGLAYWSHRGSKRWPFVAGLLWVVLLPGVIAWGWTGRRLRTSDRVPLEIVAGRMTHPTLGFSFPAPPAGFVQVSVPDDMQVAGDAFYVWSLVNDASGEAVVVIAGRQRGGVDDDWFIGMTSGFRDAVVREGGTVLADSIVTSPTFVYELNTTLADGAHSDFTCRASQDGTPAGAVVCVGVVGFDLAPLEPVRRGLTVP